MQRTAILIGATGLVGRHLLQRLLEDDDFSKVKVFGRTATGIVHEKLIEKNIMFSNLALIRSEVKGDVLFSSLGTTLKQAGSKAAQYKVDFTYQYQFARCASENDVSDYILVSSTSANAKSMFFYSRIKGELENVVKKLSFKKMVILQPSVLSGNRKEERRVEKIGARFINALGKVFGFLKKYRSSSGDEVAAAMIFYAKEAQQSRIKVYKLDQIHNAAAMVGDPK
jgi:uncharacterized protein YbjT (DUF2867 family)